jgi:hypothetical protein
MEGFWAGVWTGIKSSPGNWASSWGATIKSEGTLAGYGSRVSSHAILGPTGSAILGAAQKGLALGAELRNEAATNGANGVGRVIGREGGTEAINLAVTAAVLKGAGALSGSSAASEGASLGDLFKNGTPKASTLSEFASGQGWEGSQTESGPLKFTDGNGVVRMTLKEGSARTPGSETPHVELRDASGQRVNPEGAPVTRKSPDNHRPIEWDLKK